MSSADVIGGLMTAGSSPPLPSAPNFRATRASSGVSVLVRTPIMRILSTSFMKSARRRRSAPGARTGYRGGAGPAGRSLGGKDPAGSFA